MSQQVKECSSSSIPSALESVFNPSLKFGFVPLVNYTKPAIEACCGDSPVMVYDDCWAVCELPDALEKEMKDESKSAGDVFSRCITSRASGDRPEGGLIIGGSSPAAPSVMTPSTGPLALFILGLLCIMR